ncbi:MAG: CAP domain-containing protein [Pyrinomonadaceae bacterium]|nr:CAP domain-containing protein [Pyrinomonadaceae bacterium]
MNRKLILLAGLISILAATSFAQGETAKNSGPNTTTRLYNLESELARYIFDDEDGDEPRADRPRVVEKASGVKSSVVVNANALSRAAFDLINKKRAENGAAPLNWSEDLARVASVHSHNMAELNFFSHRGLDNKVVSDRADDAKLGRWRAIGENIAFNRGYSDPVSRTVQLWLDSPSHRRNMLDPTWKESAIGVAVAEDGSYYFTQVFLVRK